MLESIQSNLEAFMLQRGLWDYRPDPLYHDRQAPSGLSPPSSTSGKYPYYVGLATFNPQPEYPPLNSHTLPDRAEVVRVRFFPLSPLATQLPSSSRQSDLACSPLEFLRLAQLVAIDTTVPGETWGVDKDVLAWWEDQEGMCLVTRPDNPGTDAVGLMDHWEQNVKRAGKGEDKEARRFGISQEGAERTQQNSMEGPGQEGQVSLRACELSLALAKCLRNIHRASLTISTLNIASFALYPGEHPVKARIFHLDQAFASSGTDTIKATDDLRKILFARSAISHEYRSLSDDHIRQHLDKLSPESISGRVSTFTSDIYAFGTLIYGLLLGITTQLAPKSPDIDPLSDIQAHLNVTTQPLQQILGQQQNDAITPAIHSVIMRCLAKDARDRYKTFNSVIYDLERILAVRQGSRALSDLVIGQIDLQSRFRYPSRPISREYHFGILDERLKQVQTKGSGRFRYVDIWGPSGSGKSVIARTWTGLLDKRKSLTAYSKLDEHVQKPLACFVQLFRQLLYRLLADPQEDAQSWMQIIRSSLGPHYAAFYSILPNDTQNLVLLGDKPPIFEAIDWSALIPTFKLWCKRLIQSLASPDRPLVLVIDDVQWMHKEEHNVWRDVLSDGRPLLHVLVISLHRSDDVRPPQDPELLSASNIHLQVGPIDHVTTRAIVEQAFGAFVEGLDMLAGLLHNQTRGNPLYLRTLLWQLVESQAISFDFSSTCWICDQGRVYSQLSHQNVEHYLAALQSRLPGHVQALLQLLSCLPERYRSHLIRDGMDISQSDLDTRIQIAQSAGVVFIAEEKVGFTHDGQRKVAYKSIPNTQLAAVHYKAYDLLRQPHSIDEYAFDSAEHAIKAGLLSGPICQPEELVTVLLKAAQGCSLSVGFEAAKTLLGAIRGFINDQPDSKRWLLQNHKLYLEYLTLHIQVCGALKCFDESHAELDLALAAFRSTHQEIPIHTLTIRQLIAADRSAQAIERCKTVLEQYGYSLHNPTAVDLVDIDSPSVLQTLADMIMSQPIIKDGSDARVQIATLLAFITPTIYSADIDDRRPLFIMSLSLLAQIGHPIDFGSSIVALGSVTVSDIKIKEILSKFALRLVDIFPSSCFSPYALSGIASESHAMEPLIRVYERHTHAMESAISMANYDTAGWSYFLQCGVLCFSSIRIPLQNMQDRYDSIAPFASYQTQVAMQAGIECYKRLIRFFDSNTPWDHDLTDMDRVKLKPTPLYAGALRTLRFRLAILYDAPAGVMETIIESTDERTIAYLGQTIWGCEWAFLTAVHALQSGQLVDERLQTSSKRLATLSKASDFHWRSSAVTALRDFFASSTPDMERLDNLIDRLNEGRQYDVSGLLNFTIAKRLFITTKSAKLARAYFQPALSAYRLSGYNGVAERLSRAYPELGSPMSPILPGRLTQVPSHTVTADSTGLLTSDINTIPSSDHLDALTLFRSSLALTSEKDPSKLLCTLLEILCEFTRADFAAIAVRDPAVKNGLRISAAGEYNRIIPYSIDFAEEKAASVAPLSIMLQVSRSASGIVHSSSNDIPRDAFYGERAPCMLACLPTFIQGQQAGVILLSCMTSSSVFIESQSARDVISCLATFAHNIADQQHFARRLKDEVDQRTSQLLDSLQVKTLFLSQCSHELRSPLSAILGLAAVLEASEGLSEVQNEHLRTIITSGEHLLELINNILDYSRLESHSVTLETIRFDLRDLIESSIESMATIAHSKKIELCLVNSLRTDPPKLMGDPTRVKQVFINLISNAVKFTSQGTVTVEWRIEQLGESGENVMIWLDINDTGIGIPAGKMDRLFQSFSQVDASITRSYGGSGLGLVISRELARLLGGDCTAVSEYGHGSTFTFSFAAGIVASSKTPPRSPILSRKCLVLCPSGPLRDVLLENLKDLGLVVVAAELDAKGAYEQSLPSDSTFDHVFISSRYLEIRNVAQIRSSYSGTRVTLLCRNIDMAQVMRKYSVERKNLLVTPFRADDIRHVFRQEQEPNAVPDRTEQALSRKRKRSADKGLAERCPQSILVVDDNRVNLTVAQRILDMFGYSKVDSAENGQTAVDMANKNEYDVILMDIQMPVMDGFSALKALQQQHTAKGISSTTGPAVVALTADALETTQKRCAEAGFFDFVLKPPDIPKLGKVLERAYSRNHPGGQGTKRMKE